MFPERRVHLAPVPTSALRRLGGVERKPNDCLVLSRLVGGANYFAPRTLPVGSHTVRVGTGETWAAHQTMADDVLRAAGLHLTKRQVRHSLARLERFGFCTSRSAVEGANGYWGNVYTLDADLYNDDTTTDVLKQFKTYAYGDTSKFSRGEIVQERVIYRNNYGPADRFAQHVARNGLDHSAYVSVGRWHKMANCGKSDAPVFVPWLVVDVDRPNVMDAWEVAHRVLREFEAAGFPVDHTFVSYSGMKGFHVAVPTSYFGSPIFRDATSARLSLTRMVEDIVVDDVDPATLNPLGLVRCSGSVHERTGARKTTWHAPRFKSLGLHEILDAAKGAHLPVDLPDPTVGEVEDELRELFEEAAANVAAEVEKIHRDRHRASGQVGPVIARILEGITESEAWHDTHVGRNRAGYVLACFLLEDARQQRQCAWALGMEGLDNWGSEGTAWAIYEHWDATRNNGPMQTDPRPGDRRGFHAAFKSAERTVLRSKSN